MMSGEDIVLLAAMCKLCRPKIVKGRFITREYAYFVPEDKCIDIAKDLFAKNGIDMQIYFSYILGGAGRNVLRMNYKDSKNYNRDRDIFEKIRDKRIELFYKDSERLRVLNQFMNQKS